MSVLLMDPEPSSAPPPLDRAQQLLEQLQLALAPDLKALAQFLAACEDRQLLGQGEFHARDLVHRLGAKALQTALNQRKKGGTKAPQLSAALAASPPSSKAIVNAPPSDLWD